MKRIVTCLFILLITLSLILTACAKPAPAPAPVPAPTTSAPAPAPAPTPAPKPSPTTTSVPSPAPAPAPATTPAQAPKAIKWNLQDRGAAAEYTFKSSQRVAAAITANSGGRLTVEAFPSGAIAAARQELKALDLGTVDAAMIAHDLSATLFESAPLFTCTIGGLTPVQYMIWYNGGPGEELCSEQYKTLNVVNIGMCQVWTPEVWCHSTKPISSLADLKKYKFRTAGEGAEVLNRLGVTTLVVPGGEVYDSAKRGIFEVFEYSMPSTNWTMGFHEVAQYAYLSPTRFPTAIFSFFVNKTAWEKLAPDLKDIVKKVVQAEPLKFYADSVYLDAEALKKYAAYGTNVQPLPKEIEETFLKEAAKYYDEKAAKNPFYAKVLASQREVRQICEQQGIR